MIASYAELATHTRKAISARNPLIFRFSIGDVLWLVADWEGAGEERRMSADPEFGQLLRRALVALILGAFLVVVCYSFVDRPVAAWVHQDDLPRERVFAWLTYPPPILQAWAPVVFVALMVRRAWGHPHRWERTCLAACIALVLADQFKETLSYVFGRYWPDTWIDNNPSFIRDGAYGFHPYHSGTAFGSFPSGHTARILALASVVWIAYPKLQVVCILASAAVAAGLVGMDYHFVGDVIAGGLVGGIVGTYTGYGFGLLEQSPGYPNH